MDWVQSLQKAINFIEEHILEDLTPEQIAKSVYSSSAHFQRIFTMITGITIGEYIRCRRLTLAANELIHSHDKILNIAVKYHYDTAGSFTKAFTRFHGLTPSEAKKSGNVRCFAPFCISINLRGGLKMQRSLIPNVPVINYDGNNAGFFVTLLETALRAIGEECNRSKLIALSGEGNRFCWTDSTWVFGNEVTDSINNTPFETENRILTAIGWKAKYITVQRDKNDDFMNIDAKQIRQDFVHSIDIGLPVIIRYKEHADCDLNIFFGYEEDGQKIIGYPYNNHFEADRSQPSDTNMPTAWENWEDNLAGYILLQNKIESASERNAALSTFRCISEHFRNTNDIRGRNIGLAAWKSFLHHLEFDDFSELSTGEVGNRFAIYCDALCQINARSEALPYYRFIAQQFPEWREQLENAITSLEACASYGGFLWSQGFSFDEAGYEKFRSLEARKILAEAGRDAMNKDIEAVEQFEKILNCER